MRKRFFYLLGLCVLLLLTACASIEQNESSKNNSSGEAAETSMHYPDCDCLPELEVPDIHCFFKDSIYSLSYSQEDLQKYGIYEAATAELCGDLLGEAMIESYEEESKGEVYSIKGRRAKSVLLFKQGDQISYMVFLNLIDSQSTAVPLLELLKIHGITDRRDIAKAEVTVEIEGVRFSDISSELLKEDKISSLWDAFSTIDTVMGTNQYMKECFEGKSYEEQDKLYTKLADELIEIELMKGTEHYISFWYYKSIGYFESHICYYPVSKEIQKQLNEILQKGV